MSEKQKTALDAAFEEVESVFSENRVIRREMINQLRKQVTKMEISEYDKPMMIQAKLMIGKTLDDLLKSDEDVSVKKLKMKLARKDSETNGMVGQTIVNLLKNIRVNGEPSDNNESVSRDNVMEELQKQQESNKELAISDGEVEECGSTPSTDGNEPIVTKEEKEDDEDE